MNSTLEKLSITATSKLWISMNSTHVTNDDTPILLCDYLYYRLTLSLFKGETATVKHVGDGGDGEGVPNCDADLIFDLIENEQ